MKRELEALNPAAAFYLKISKNRFTGRIQGLVYRPNTRIVGLQAEYKDWFTGRIQGLVYRPNTRIGLQAEYKDWFTERIQGL